MRVAIITPVRNAEAWIAQTVISILGQSVLNDPRKEDIHLHYIIRDGGSTDATVHHAQLAIDAHATQRVTTEVVSTPDNGMYDALAQGFRSIEAAGGADWYAYLNAGDLWDPHCLEVLSAVDRHPQVTWLMGLHAYYSPGGSLVHTRLPVRYRRTLLRHGAYGRGLPTVQQESTLWRAELHRTADWWEMSTYRTAGDAYLWWTFAASTEPYVVEALLGGFRYHGHHLGVSASEYEREMLRFAGPIPVTMRAQMAAERALWEQPARIKARLSDHLLKFRTDLGGWSNNSGSITIA